MSQTYWGHVFDLSVSRAGIGHVTVQVAIFYRCSIETKSVPSAFVEIMGPKHIEVATLTFQGHVMA